MTETPQETLKRWTEVGPHAGLGFIVEAIRTVLANHERAAAAYDALDLKLNAAEAEVKYEQERNRNNVAQYGEQVAQLEAQLRQSEVLGDQVEQADIDIKALGFEVHPAVLMRMDRLVRSLRGEGEK